MGYGYVIVDNEGRYVTGSKGTFLLTNDEYMYISYTGRTTGFCYFKGEQQQAEKEKEDLQRLCNQYGFNKQFHTEYIKNIRDISTGKMIIENLFLISCKKIINL